MTLYWYPRCRDALNTNIMYWWDQASSETYWGERRAADGRRAEWRGVARHNGVLGTGKRAQSDSKGRQSPSLFQNGNRCWQWPTHRAWHKQWAQCGVIKEFGKDFHKMQLVRGGTYIACKGRCRKTHLKPQQPLSGMIFTNVLIRGILSD